MTQDKWNKENFEEISELINNDILKDFKNGNGDESHAKLWSIVENDEIAIERIITNTKSKVKTFVRNYLSTNLV